jgi:hypothetical protein
VYWRHLIRNKSSLKAGVEAAVEEDQVLDLVDQAAWAVLVEQDQAAWAVLVEQDQAAWAVLVEQDQAGQAVPVHRVDLTNTSQMIIMAIMETMDTMDTMDIMDPMELVVNGWAIPGIGGTDMVIGEAGTTVALVGGGIPGMVIPGGGGTEIIGEAGYPVGAPSLVRTDPTTIGNSEEDPTSFIFFMNVKSS